MNTSSAAVSRESPTKAQVQKPATWLEPKWLTPQLVRALFPVLVVVIFGGMYEAVATFGEFATMLCVIVSSLFPAIIVLVCANAEEQRLVDEEIRKYLLTHSEASPLEAEMRCRRWGGDA